jgi:hypothetical protein
MPAPEDPSFATALDAASARLHLLHGELLDAHPALRGNLSIPGMLVGYGLGSFVGNGMTDDQIVAQVLVIVANIRRTLGAEVPPPPDDVEVH